MSSSARFAAIPPVPQGGITDWQAAILQALKENVELMIGTRGEADGASTVVTKGSIATDELAEQSMVRLTATGAGFTISAQDVPSLADHVKLMTDVQTLANDLYATRTALNALLAELKR